MNETFSGKEEYVTLLGNLGNAVATGAAPGEDLTTISTGSVGLKVNTPVRHVQLCLSLSKD